jgi:hypothetical protein
MINNAVLIQHTYSNCNVFNPTFPDMQRLIYPRHSAYCASHNIDFWSLQGGKYPKMTGESGAWAKVGLVREALQDYEFVFWIDVDAAIMDFETDLRDACKDINIGGVVHDPAKSEYLKAVQVQRHINVGCLYFRNTDTTRLFVDKWFDAWPGPVRWADQGAFNALTAEIPDAVTEIDDKWNATVNVNMVEKPVVMGWHGILLHRRFLMMKDKLINDHLDFRV